MGWLYEKNPALQIGSGDEWPQEEVLCPVCRGVGGGEGLSYPTRTLDEDTRSLRGKCRGSRQQAGPQTRPQTAEANREITMAWIRPSSFRCAQYDDR